MPILSPPNVSKRLKESKTNKSNTKIKDKITKFNESVKLSFQFGISVMVKEQNRYNSLQVTQKKI